MSNSVFGVTALQWHALDLFYGEAKFYQKSSATFESIDNDSETFVLVADKIDFEFSKNFLKNNNEKNCLTLNNFKSH